MAHVTADRVRDTSTSTSTGDFVVSGTAPTGFRTLSAVLSVSDTFYYAIQSQTDGSWEVGLGTYSSANTFARTTVLSSSNAGSAVNFSAGTKDVFLTLAATRTIQREADGSVYDASGAGSDRIFFLLMTWMLCDCGDGVKTWFMPTSKATMNAMRTKASENVIIVILLNQAQDFGKVKTREFVSNVNPLAIN